MAHTPGNIYMSDRLMDSMWFDLRYVSSLRRNVSQYCRNYLHCAWYLGQQRNIQCLIIFANPCSHNRLLLQKMSQLVLGQFQEANWYFEETRHSRNSFHFDWNCNNGNSMKYASRTPWTWRRLNIVFAIWNKIYPNILLQCGIWMYTLLANVYNIIQSAPTQSWNFKICTEKLLKLYCTQEPKISTMHNNNNKL